MHSFDLIIIGGGPAGYLAAERAGAAGLSVAVIEKRALGGVCLNEGCIPSKAFLYSAKIFENARKGARYGVNFAGGSIDHAAVVARKNRVVKRLVMGVEAKLENSGATVVRARAALKGKGPAGFKVEADGAMYAATKLLIATGSTPVIPNISGLTEGLKSGFVISSRGILDMEDVPERLAVIGGGVVGLEMASYFCSAGAQVTVVEMLDKIAGQTEAEIAAVLFKSLQKKGIEFHLGSRVKTIGSRVVTVENEEGETGIPADKVLLSAGRAAAAQALGLDSIGVECEGGAIVTDKHMRTNVPGVYAAGDVTGKSMLAHTAYREAEVAVNHMTGQKDAMRYDAIPVVIYTDPEVATVGETEQSAREKGIEYRVAKLPMNYAGRYVAEVDGGEGLCKLVMDKKKGCVIGAHLVGPYVSEMIYGAGMMIEKKMPVEDIQKMVFPHPTVSEIIRETLFVED